MSAPPPAQPKKEIRWKPHPKDEENVRQGMESVDRGELLSPEASEKFLRWLEGSGDESWRDEFG